MKSILVTGANGFVGHWLASELAGHGYRVIGTGGKIIDSKPPQHTDNYQVLDLTDPAAAEAIDFKAVDGVIHLAGLAAVGPSFDQPMAYLSTNMGIEVNLFEAARAQKATPTFVIVSSGALYDQTAPLPLTEASPVLPSSPYAVSKLGQEHLAAYYSSRGFKCIVARPFNHIGPGQGLGFIVPDITQQVVEAERGLRKEVTVGNLDAERDYTDVRDIVTAYRLLFEEGHSGETYNVCSGTPRSGHVMLEGILSASGTQPKVTVDSEKMRPSDNPKVYGDHQKLTDHTGWQPKISIEATLHDVVEDWRARL